jgi:hypothetical protein
MCWNGSRLDYGRYIASSTNHLSAKRTLHMLLESGDTKTKKEKKMILGTAPWGRTTPPPSDFYSRPEARSVRHTLGLTDPVSPIYKVPQSIDSPFFNPPDNPEPDQENLCNPLSRYLSSRSSPLFLRFTS